MKCRAANFFNPESNFFKIPKVLRMKNFRDFFCFNVCSFSFIFILSLNRNLCKIQIPKQNIWRFKMEHHYTSQEQINQEIEEISNGILRDAEKKKEYSLLWDKQNFFEKMASVSGNLYHEMKKAFSFFATVKMQSKNLGDFMTKTPIFIDVKKLYEEKNNNDVISFPTSCLFLNRLVKYAPKNKGSSSYENLILLYSRAPCDFSKFLSSNHLITGFSDYDLVQVGYVDFFTGKIVIDKSLLPTDIVRPEFVEEVAALLDEKFKPFVPCSLREKLKDCSVDDVFEWYCKTEEDKDFQGLGFGKCQWDLTDHNADFWLSAWLLNQWHGCETGATLENAFKITAEFENKFHETKKQANAIYDDVFCKWRAEHHKTDYLQAHHQALIEKVTPFMAEMTERNSNVKCFKDNRYKAVFCKFAGVVLDIEKHFRGFDVQCDVIAFIPTNEQGKPKPNANLKLVKKSDFETHFIAV